MENYLLQTTDPWDMIVEISPNNTRESNEIWSFETIYTSFRGRCLVGHIVFSLLFDNNFAHSKTESAASQDSGMVHNMSIRSSLTPNIFIFVIPLCLASPPPPLRNRTLAKQNLEF